MPGPSAQEKGASMKRALLLALFVALLSLPAFGAGESYPSTLIDQGCTDSYDTPAAVAEPNLVIEPPEQVSGSADGTCDLDSRILTGALTSDTTFGPLRGGRSACIYLFADGNTVTGGDTKWTIDVYIKQPHDGVLQVLEQGTLITGNLDVLFLLGVSTAHNPSIASIELLTARLPEQFWLTLDLDTATSWTGELSMARCWF